MHGIGTTRLHLLLAAVAALTGTAYGLAIAGTVLLVLGLRLWARESLTPEGSVAVGARVLASTQHADVLDAPGGARHRLAG